jgi:hypothetical protein
VCGKLQDSALTVGTSRDDTDIGWVVDSCDDAGCKDDFLPIINLSVNSVVLRQKFRSAQNCSYQVLPMLMTLIPSGRVFQR